ncbi:hypothetical protein GW17_00018606 [Ensete ventricosum]|nr:hypothetical protein GW17_00018606 [Ensete ventricosum]
MEFAEEGRSHRPGLGQELPRKLSSNSLTSELKEAIDDDLSWLYHIRAEPLTDVVAGGSTQFGSSRVRKLIHVGWERGVQLGSVLYLENLYLGLATRAPLRSASVVRVLHEGLVGVGAPDVIPSDAQVSVPVGLVQA